MARQRGWRSEIAGVPLPMFFVSVHSKGLEVLCFDTDLQVFIPLGLRIIFVCRVVTGGRESDAGSLRSQSSFKMAVYNMCIVMSRYIIIYGRCQFGNWWRRVRGLEREFAEGSGHWGGGGGWGSVILIEA